jgi:RAD54-like protein 2
MDNCLEKKIYDRQINKQGMADRVVDECNPDAHLSIKEVTNLCWDNEQDTEPRDFSAEKDKYIDVVLQKVLDKFSSCLSKVHRFFCSSLLLTIGCSECRLIGP